MQLTFGICTAGGQSQRVQRIIDSIVDEQIQDYEVIVVGDCKVLGAKMVPFDEAKPGWITKKKNLIAGMAKKSILVLMHDYIRLLPGWYEAYLGFGEDWDVCTNVMLKEKGERAYDWFALNYKQHKGHALVDYSLPENPFAGHMYPAGNYFLVKTQFIRDNPLDEKLVWGQNEDHAWMRGLFRKWKYRFNASAKIQYMKPHHHWPNYSTVITKP